MCVYGFPNEWGIPETFFGFDTLTKSHDLDDLWVSPF